MALRPTNTLRPTNRRMGLAIRPSLPILTVPRLPKINFRRKITQPAPPRKELSIRRKVILPPPPREEINFRRKITQPAPPIKGSIIPKGIISRTRVDLIRKVKEKEEAKRKSAFELQKIKLAVTPNLTKVTDPAVKQTIDNAPKTIDMVQVPDGAVQAGMPLGVKIVIGSLVAGTALMYVLRPKSQSKGKTLSGTKTRKTKNKITKKPTHKVKAVALT